MPGITGKLELEYEGEMRGADTVVRELIRTAVGKIFDRYFVGVETQEIEQWFNLGGTVKLDENQPAAAALKELKAIQGLLDKLSPLGVKPSDAAPEVVAAAEFLLEGLVAHRKLSRNEQHGFAAQEGVRLREREDRNREDLSQERKELETDYEDWERARRKRRGGGGLN